jgi:hypothetical protein
LRLERGDSVTGETRKQNASHHPRQVRIDDAVPDRQVSLADLHRRVWADRNVPVGRNGAAASIHRRTLHPDVSDAAALTPPRNLPPNEGGAAAASHRKNLRSNESDAVA